MRKQPQAFGPPKVQTSWQWQLTTPIDMNVNAEVFDIDLYNNSASVVSQLHARGKKAICNISAGTWERWRPDASKFPTTVKGSKVSGWAGEQWLDIRQWNVLGPIMEARLDLCKAKGFDGVEPDNVDGYDNRSGFPLTYQDQITYNMKIAAAAHARGWSVGLENDIAQLRQLAPYFDSLLSKLAEDGRGKP